MAINYYNQLEEPLWKTCQAEGKSSTSFIRKSLSTGSRYHLPASCFFDWRDFSIFIEDKDAHKAGHFSSSSECLETQNDSNLLSGLSIASKFQDRSSDIKWYQVIFNSKKGKIPMGFLLISRIPWYFLASLWGRADSQGLLGRPKAVGGNEGESLQNSEGFHVERRGQATGSTEGLMLRNYHRICF